MRFCSILYEQGDCVHRYTQPDFFVDLNIDQILKSVQNGFPEQDISRFWNHLPPDRECSLYRQEIYRDIKQSGLYDVLEEYLNQIRKSRAFGRRTYRIIHSAPQLTSFGLDLYQEIVEG